MSFSDVSIATWASKGKRDSPSTTLAGTLLRMLDRLLRFARTATSFGMRALCCLKLFVAAAILVCDFDTHNVHAAWQIVISRERKGTNSV